MHSHLWVCPFLSYPYPPSVPRTWAGAGVWPPVCHCTRSYRLTAPSLHPPPQHLPPEHSAPFIASFPHVYIKQLISETLTEVSAVDLPPTLFQLSHYQSTLYWWFLSLFLPGLPLHPIEPVLLLLCSIYWIHPWSHLVTSGVWVTIWLLPTAFWLFWYLLRT